MLLADTQTDFVARKAAGESLAEATINAARTKGHSNEETVIELLLVAIDLLNDIKTNTAP
jgi:translation elongation factor EF-Ts